MFSVVRLGIEFRTFDKVDLIHFYKTFKHTIFFIRKKKKEKIFLPSTDFSGVGTCTAAVLFVQFSGSTAKAETAEK